MRAFAAALLLTLSLNDSVSSQSPDPPYADRPLIEVLDSLRERGLSLVFTSRFVGPEMRVAVEPVASEPRAILFEILAPHGLTAQEEAGGVLVVVAAPARGGLDGSTAPGHSLGASQQMVLREEIFVRPSRLSLLQDRTDSTFSFGRDEIEALPHLGGDIFRAASLLPGVAANDVSAQFSVHGGRRDEVRVLLDGQELYDAYHLKDYDNALSVVAAEALGGATLTTGAFAASHGDRMSGVLELRTVESQDGRRQLLGLSVLDALASTAGRSSGGRSSWLATARRGSLDLAAQAIGDENPRFWDAFGRAEMTSEWGTLAARLLAAGDELELNKKQGEEFERFENSYRSTYGWITHQATPRPTLLLETLGSWSQVQRERGGATSEEEGGFTLKDERNLDVFGLSQSSTLQLGARHSLGFGWEARRYDIEFDYDKNLEPEFVVLAPFAPDRPTVHSFARSLRGEHLGLWTSGHFSPLERLTAELGLRYDRHTATDDTILSPRLSAAYSLGERSVVRTAWGRFFQSQRPYELEVADAESALHSVEHTEHWILGYETLFRRPLLGPIGWNALRVEAFRRDIDDPRPRYESLLEPLNFFPEIEPDRVRIAPSRSEAKGVELLLRGDGGRRASWWLAYSYSRIEDRLGGEKVPRLLDQPHTLTADVDLRLAPRWRLNLAWRYHTGWPTTPVNTRRIEIPDPEEPEEPEDPEDPEEEIRVVPVFGKLNSRRVPDYHRLDLRASRRQEFRSGTLTVYVDIQNVYDRRNLAGFDVKVDEEADTVETEAEHWPGLFPSIGVTWRF